jgi:hypothetical protein
MAKTAFKRRARSAESKFGKWLKREGITERAFAARHKLSVSYVYALSSGIRVPGWELRRQIEKLSGGAVGFDDWRILA